MTIRAACEPQLCPVLLFAAPCFVVAAAAVFKTGSSCVLRPALSQRLRVQLRWGAEGSACTIPAVGSLLCVQQTGSGGSAVFGRERAEGASQAAPPHAMPPSGSLQWIVAALSGPLPACKGGVVSLCKVECTGMYAWGSIVWLSACLYRWSCQPVQSWNALVLGSSTSGQVRSGAVSGQRLACRRRPVTCPAHAATTCTCQRVSVEALGAAVSCVRVCLRAVAVCARPGLCAG